MFKSFSSKKTVASVLGVFSQAIEDLNRVEGEQRDEADRQRQIALEADAARVASLNEANLAREVCAKLSDLIGSQINVTELTIGELAEQCA